MTAIRQLLKRFLKEQYDEAILRQREQADIDRKEGEAINKMTEKVLKVIDEKVIGQ
jgi:hypothetical protein